MSRLAIIVLLAFAGCQGANPANAPNDLKELVAQIQARICDRLIRCGSLDVADRDICVGPARVARRGAARSQG
jgi:hypothetical protein